MINRGDRVEVIDADAFRLLKGNDDYSDGGRKQNLYAVAERASELEATGALVIMAFIAPTERVAAANASQLARKACWYTYQVEPCGQGLSMKSRMSRNCALDTKATSTVWCQEDTRRD